MSRIIFGCNRRKTWLVIRQSITALKRRGLARVSRMETGNRMPTTVFRERAAIIRNRLPLDRTMVPVISTLVTSTAHRRHDNVRPRISTLLENKLLGKKLLDSRLQRPEAHQNDIRKRGTKRPFLTKIIRETTRKIERFRVIGLLHGLSTDWDHRPTIEPVAPTVRFQGQTVCYSPRYFGRIFSH